MLTSTNNETPLVGIDTNPLIDFALISLRELPHHGYYNLRCDAQDAGFIKIIRDVLGLDVPTTPNTIVENDKASMLWLGPDEWMLVTGQESETDFVYLLRGAMADHFYTLTEISSGYTSLLLKGLNAAEVIAKGCTLDLHKHIFAPGQCAQTLIAKTGVIIIPRNGEYAGHFDYQLIVRRSFADYLWRWLSNAMREWKDR